MALEKRLENLEQQVGVAEEESLPNSIFASIPLPEGTFGDEELLEAMESGRVTISSHIQFHDNRRPSTAEEWSERYGPAAPPRDPGAKQ